MELLPSFATASIDAAATDDAAIARLRACHALFIEGSSSKGDARDPTLVAQTICERLREH